MEEFAHVSKAPMRMHVDINGKESRKDNHYEHSSDIYHKITLFLKGNVGKNFDKVFARFCQKYPKIYGGENTRKLFIKRFPCPNVKVDDSTLPLHMHGYYFRIDEDKNIRHIDDNKNRVGGCVLKNSDNDTHEFRYFFNTKFILTNYSLFVLLRQDHILKDLIREDNVIDTDDYCFKKGELSISEEEFEKNGVREKMIQVAQWLVINSDILNTKFAFDLLKEPYQYEECCPFGSKFVKRRYKYAIKHREEFISKGMCDQLLDMLFIQCDITDYKEYLERRQKELINLDII